jgi:omega-amidase
MRITVVQPDIEWENKKGNFARLERLISDIRPGTDLVILPEMFNTGFSMNPERLYEPPNAETCEWLGKMSLDGNYGICASYIVREKNRFYNRWILVTPDRESWHYNKRHLFRMSNEEKLFTPGRVRQTFTFRGVRICPNICYDLRFPVWSRNRNDYDLLINVANWPAARRDVWLTLLKARAIENQCFVAGANRIGTDGAGINYSGDSMIIDPKGEIIISAEDNECIITADISMDELREFRKKFPVLDDADDFDLEL